MTDQNNTTTVETSQTNPNSGSIFLFTRSEIV